MGAQLLEEFEPSPRGKKMIERDDIDPTFLKPRKPCFTRRRRFDDITFTRKRLLDEARQGGIVIDIKD